MKTGGWGPVEQAAVKRRPRHRAKVLMAVVFTGVLRTVRLPDSVRMPILLLKKRFHQTEPPAQGIPELCPFLLAGGPECAANDDRLSSWRILPDQGEAMSSRSHSRNIDGRFFSTEEICERSGGSVYFDEQPVELLVRRCLIKIDPERPLVS